MEPLQNQQAPSQFIPPTVPPVYVPDHNVLNGNHHKKVGPIVVTLIVIIAIIVVAMYALSSKVNKTTPPLTPTSAENMNAGNNQVPTQSPDVTVQSVTGTSDDLNSLQSDLNASTNGVDSQQI